MPLQGRGEQGWGRKQWPWVGWCLWAFTSTPPSPQTWMDGDELLSGEERGPHRAPSSYGPLLPPTAPPILNPSN